MNLRKVSNAAGSKTRVTGENTEQIVSSVPSVLHRIIVSNNTAPATLTVSGISDPVTTWTAAGQTLANKSDIAVPTLLNWRDVIESGVATTDGDEVRLKFEGRGGTGNIVINGLTIGIRSGSTDDFTGAPTEINYSGAAVSAGNPLTVPPNTTVYSDWTPFTFDETVAHLVAFWNASGFTTVKWEEGAGTNSYSSTNAADESETVAVTYTPATGSYHLSAIEVRSIVPLNVIEIGAPESKVITFNAQFDHGIRVTPSATTVDALIMYD